MTQVEPAPQSEPTPRRSRSPMQVVAERSTPDPQRLEGTTAWEALTPSPPKTTTSPTGPSPVDRAWRAGVLGAVNVLALVLSGRLLVLVAIAGAIFLTWLALANPDPYRLAALGIYCLLAVVPCVWLASATGK